MKSRFLAGALVVLVIAGGLLVASLHRANTRLRTQVNEQRTAREARESRPKALSAPMPAASTNQVASLAENDAGARMARLRAEIAALEKKAAEQLAANPDLTDAPSTHRDPEQAMTKLEYMRNVGQGTPAAALQTLFWAFFQGDEQAMAQAIDWDEATRSKAEALIARLPAESRALYPTPGHLLGLHLSKYAMDVSAIHISETTMEDATHATLTVKGLTGRDEKLPMRRGSYGWQLLAGEANLMALSDTLAGKSEN